jgi:hypothetical protein
LRSTVDQEQNTGDQRADPRNDVQDSAKPNSQQAQAKDDQKDGKQDPFQFFHIHDISPLLKTARFLSGKFRQAGPAFIKKVFLKSF